jgi:hypothetical protein
MARSDTTTLARVDSTPANPALRAIGFIGLQAALASWLAFGLGATTLLWWMPIVLASLWLLAGAPLPPVAPFRGIAARSRARRQKQLAELREQELLAMLSDGDRRRYYELERLRMDIQGEVLEHPGFAMQMVRVELDKLDALLRTFLEVAANAAKYELFIATSDLAELEREVERQEAVIDKTLEADARGLAEKNHHVLLRRVEKAVQIRRQLRVARAQLNLIDNTLRLLRDQVMTMETPDQLSLEVEELTDAVEQIAATGRETDAIVKRLDAELVELEPPTALQ